MKFSKETIVAIENSTTIEDIRTGSTPIVAGNVTITRITSGGTGGVEYIHLFDLENVQNGDPSTFNPHLQGRRHVFFLETLNDPADVVTIVASGWSGEYGPVPFVIYDNAGTTLATVTTGGDGPKLDQVGHALVCEWITDVGWTLALAATVNADLSGGVYTANAQYVPGIDRLGTDTGKSLTAYGSNVFFLSRVGIEAPQFVGSDITKYLTEQGNFYQLDGLQDGIVLQVLFPQAGVPAAGPLPAIGYRVMIYGFQGMGKSTDLDVSNIRDASGSAVTSINVADGQYILLEIWDADVWRIQRGTAVVT